MAKGRSPGQGNPTAKKRPVRRPWLGTREGRAAAIEQPNQSWTWPGVQEPPLPIRTIIAAEQATATETPSSEPGGKQPAKVGAYGIGPYGATGRYGPGP